MLEAVLVFALLASVRTWGAYESKAVQAQDTSASLAPTMTIGEP